MTILVTGSTGHLGEALMRTCVKRGIDAVGLDIKASPFTQYVGSLVDAEFVSAALQDVSAIVHCATLHKPHVATHSRQDFVDTNITGTLNLLEAAVQQGIESFVYTSTTSTFGDAMQHKAGRPAVWISEDLQSVPKNIYGVSKVAAENLCQLFWRNAKLPSIVLRTSRFFPEEDDSAQQRALFADDNLKVNELLHRRADIADIVEAHLLALKHCKTLGFGRFIVSATSPFCRADMTDLADDAESLVARYFPQYRAIYQQLGWHMYPAINRVYDNAHAQQTLGWEPRYTFAHALECLAAGRDYRSPLTLEIGIKRYHDQLFDHGPYPVDEA